MNWERGRGESRESCLRRIERRTRRFMATPPFLSPLWTMLPCSFRPRTAPPLSPNNMPKIVGTQNSPQVYVILTTSSMICAFLRMLLTLVQYIFIYCSSSSAQRYLYPNQSTYSATVLYPSQIKFVKCC